MAQSPRSDLLYSYEQPRKLCKAVVCLPRPRGRPRRTPGRVCRVHLSTSTQYKTRISRQIMPEEALRWPQSFASLFAGVLPNHLLAQVLGEAEQLAASPNYWLPRDTILAEGQQTSSAEAVIRILYNGHIHRLLPSAFAGAEWWVQAYKPGHGLAFHFDKDETLFKERQVMRHPLLSSVLYLTGSAEQERLAPTVVVDQQFDNCQQKAAPEHPERSALIWPQGNSLCVFDGRLGHGVLDSTAKGQRTTMLINWWSYQPQAVHRPPSSPQQAYQLVHESSAYSPYLQREDIACHTEGDDVQADFDAGKAEQARRLPIAVLKIPPSDEPQAITIDDLLESFGISCSGCKAVHAVAIEHPGYHLYTVSADEGEQFESLQTAGALVSRELLQQSESNED